MSTTMRQIWSNLGSITATGMFIWAIISQYFPHQYWRYIEKYCNKFVNLVYPYIDVTFHEFAGGKLKRSDVFTHIQAYLSANSTMGARRFRADVVKDSRSIILSMDDKEEVMDEFQGVKIWWVLGTYFPQRQSFSFYPTTDERRYYRLSFHKRHRNLIIDSYIHHVLMEGKAKMKSHRQRKLYSNNPSKDWDGWKQTKWSHVNFEHPATFDTLAMEAKKKDEIKKDLIKFSKSKDYYAKIGKAWKRGYLLYGPPGTGKSTMIAAIANFLDYDVYDLELTTVMNNTELRNLLIETSNKSVIVIEDIDCSLDLTGQREKKKKKKKKENDGESSGAGSGDGVEEIKKKEKEDGDDKRSKVTLSGLLNFIDGLWSACGGERIIIFTTNYVEKLDPALIRRGRMDKRIEMSYCKNDAFRVLARNYLDVESHELLEEIERKLEETDMTPADVAENLMPKSDEDDVDTCLRKLIQALDVAKEEARNNEKEKCVDKSSEDGLKENGKGIS